MKKILTFIAISFLGLAGLYQSTVHANLDITHDTDFIQETDNNYEASNDILGENPTQEEKRNLHKTIQKIETEIQKEREEKLEKENEKKVEKEVFQDNESESTLSNKEVFNLITDIILIIFLFFYIIKELVTVEVVVNKKQQQ